MKKILFAAVTLDVGGIETALVTLLNYLAGEKENEDYKYDITLVLEKKQGIFLDTLDKRIHVSEYTPSSNKIVILRKFINFLKQRKFKNEYGNKFDFSAAYATYSLPASFVARTASENSALWCHMDYLEQFEGDHEKVKNFFKEKHFEKFKNLVFVSEKSRKSFLKVFPDMEEKVYFINNLINDKEIINKAQEKLDIDIQKNEKTIFLNVGRHDEKQKKLSRIIEACKLLTDKNLEFQVIFIGDGNDTQKYKTMVQDYNLEKSILFLGRKKNPYPYFKISDCVILTSDYEGSPVVFTEAMILNKPIITTEVAGSEQIKDKFGFITSKNITDIAEKMELFINKEYSFCEKFEPEKYNEEILKKVQSLIF